MAEARAGGVTLTAKLVKSDGDWVLDDEASPFHNSSAGSAFGQEDESDGPIAFGEPARFTNIPGIGPSTAITVIARPLASGRGYVWLRRLT